MDYSMRCDTHTHVIILHLHAHTHKLGLNGMTQNNHFHTHTCEYANLAWIIVLIIISPVCSASGGELFKLIAVDPIPENQAREVVWQLLEGVSHLHSFNVVHLDLKVCTPVNNMIRHGFVCLHPCVLECSIYWNLPMPSCIAGLAACVRSDYFVAFRLGKMTCRCVCVCTLSF